MIAYTQNRETLKSGTGLLFESHCASYAVFLVARTVCMMWPHSLHLNLQSTLYCTGTIRLSYTSFISLWESPILRKTFRVQCVSSTANSLFVGNIKLFPNYSTTDCSHLSIEISASHPAKPRCVSSLLMLYQTAHIYVSTLRGTHYD